MPDRKVILITGASSGLGLACATHLHELGYHVYGTSRRPEKYPDLPFTLIPMDVTDDDSVREAVGHVVAQEGRLDVLVNNAGMGIAGAVEDTSDEEAFVQLETNFMGPMRVCRAVLPIMREQGGGLIFNVSSIGGLIGIPFQGLYSASKFAIEGMSEALRLEVRPYGIRVTLIEPGDFRTGFTDQRRWTAASQGSPYQERAERAVNIMANDEQNGTDPIVMARLLARLIKKRVPRMRYTVGSPIQRIEAFLKSWVQHELVEMALVMIYKLGW